MVQTSGPRPQVAPTAGAGVRLRPIDAGGMLVTGGLWADQRRSNIEASIPHGLEQLEASGAIGNFRNAAAGSGTYRGGLDDTGAVFPFLDTDVHKWLEAVAWAAVSAGPSFATIAEPVIDAVVKAQRPDGYLGTYVQLTTGTHYQDLQWGHELYNVGHLLQAAIAWTRVLGDDRLLRTATRAVDHVANELGPVRRDGIDGHPEIEMALVELYRETGAERHLELARHLLDQRGRGLLGAGRFGRAYWQDHLPVREAPTVAGHAVRQMYLDCGVVDVAVETGDQQLLDAAVRRWTDMTATRTYLTGALGSRHQGEAFGDAYELPPDRAYAETCAAIGSVMLAWRLLLATGEMRFADAIERALYNGVLSGRSLDGQGFFYVNPLLVRAGGTGYQGGPAARAPWYACACCPPNLMRLIASVDQLSAATDTSGVVITQFLTGDLRVSLPVGEVRLRITTEQPWAGAVNVEVLAAPEAPWSLGLRVPAWSQDARVGVASSGAGFGELDPAAMGDDVVRVERRWAPGDRLRLVLDQRPRLTFPDRRIDALRGCAAVEYGPLVYCLEQGDIPGPTDLVDLALRADRPPTIGPRSEELDASTHRGRGARAPGRRSARVAVPRARADGGGGQGDAGPGPVPPLGEPDPGRDARLDPHLARDLTASHVPGTAMSSNTYVCGTAYGSEEAPSGRARLVARQSRASRAPVSLGSRARTTGPRRATVPRAAPRWPRRCVGSPRRG